MAALRIQLFGTVRVWHEGRLPDPKLSRAVQSLLAWLLLHRGRTHAREPLAAVFWNEQSEERARGCLSTALWRLRQVLEPRGIQRGTYLIAQPDIVGFNCDSDYWLDVAAFEDGVGRQLPGSPRVAQTVDWSRAEAAVACYTGDLLEGFYADWALRERERLRMLYLDCLARLLRRHSETGALEQAIRCGRQILALDPLREDVHREMMRLHVRNGHRALAVQQYESCRAALEAELGVEPMEETRSLSVDLLGLANLESPPKASGAVRLKEIAAAGGKLRLTPALRAAVARLDEARRALAEALRLAESDQN
jgi:DNA-binding SARP family transcriptional activator